MEGIRRVAPTTSAFRRRLVMFCMPAVDYALSYPHTEQERIAAMHKVFARCSMNPYATRAGFLGSDLMNVMRHILLPASLLTLGALAAEPAATPQFVRVAPMDVRWHEIPAMVCRWQRLSVILTNPASTSYGSSSRLM
jgi:hypothetical protein